jgi:hypothetical protein
MLAFWSVPLPETHSCSCWVCSPNLETNLGRVHRTEGIAKAKEAGIYKGRKPSTTPTKLSGFIMQPK